MTGLDDRATLNVIIDIPSTEWHSIGLDLGLSENDLSRIEKNRRRDTNAMKRDMLGLWLHQDTTSTYRKLAKAMLRVDGLNNDVEDLLKCIG